MSSFNYRSGSELLLPLFPKERVNLISSLASDRFKDKEASLGKFFSFALSDSNKRYLTEKGVYLSPFSGDPHSHPVCKTIENYFIYVVLPGLLSNLGSCVLSSIKINKFNNIKKRVKNSCGLKVVNRIIDAKDAIRYCNAEDVRSVISAPESFEAFNECPINENYFFFDEVHYWTPNSMLNFLEQKRPNVMMFSVVFPVEALFDYKFSANPNVYSFSIKGDEIEFYPDGVVSESYRQPLNMKWLFRSNLFVLQDQSTYSVTLYKTIAAHHFFVVSKVSSVVEKKREFNDFDLLDLGNLLELNYRFSVDGVRLSLFKRIVTYLTCLKNPDYQSAVAKLRQMCGDDVNLKEMMFFRDFAEKFSDVGISSLSGDGLIKSFFVGLFDKFPNLIKRVSSRFTKDVLLRSIVEAKQVSFDFDLVKFRRGDELTFYFRMCNFFGSQQEEVGEGLLRPYDGGNWSNSIFHYITKRQARSEFGLLNDYPPTWNVHEKFCADRKFVLIAQECFGGGVAGVFSVDCKNGDLLVRVEFKSKFLFLFESGDKVYAVSFPVFQPLSWVKREEVNEFISNAEELENEIDSLYGDDFSVGEDGVEDNENNVCGMESSSDPSVDKCGGEGKCASLFNFSVGVFRSRPIFEELGVEQGSDVDGFLESLDFNKADRLKRRSAFFFSDSRFYGHDNVRYRTFSIPEFLANLILEAGLDVNSILVQRFDVGGSIPMHADDEDCYEPDIPVFCISSGEATLSWCKKDRRDEVHSFDLSGVCLYTMPEGFQKKFLHSVKSNGCNYRYSLTFRKQSRQVYDGVVIDSETIFKESNANEDVGVDAKNSCFIQAASMSCNRSVGALLSTVSAWSEILFEKLKIDEGLSFDECHEVSEILGLRFKVVDVECNETKFIGAAKSRHLTKTLTLNNSHFECIEETGYQPQFDSESGKSSNRKLADLTELEGVNGISKVSHQVDVAGAEMLCKSLLMGATGVCSDETFSGARNKGYDFSINYKDTDLMVLYGFAGCGKSSPIQRIIDGVNFGRVLVISPRKNLLNDWMLKCKNNKNLLCKTFELALNVNLRRFKLIILDECSLFPKGYLDLLLIKMYREKSVSKLLLIGDPLQAEYYCKTDDLILEKGASNMPMAKNTKYLGYSHRCGDWLEKALPGVSVAAQKVVRDGGECKVDSVCHINDLSASKIILTPSFALKEFFSGTCLDAKVMTYGESQGLTFDDVTIIISRESRAVDDGRLLVAFTRSRNQPKVYFHETDIKVFRGLSTSKILRAFLFNEKFEIEKFLGLIIVQKSSLIGRKADKERVKKKKEKKEKLATTVESRTSGDPWLKAMLPLFSFVENENLLPVDVDCVEPIIKSHVPLAPTNFSYTAASQSDPFGLRKDELNPFTCQSKMENCVRRPNEDRESVATGVKTLQFDRMNVGGRTYVANQADGFEAIYPTHSGDDSATFMMAVRKRLRFSNPIAEAAEIEDAWSKSYVLYSNLKDKLLSGLDGRFDEEMFDECLKEFTLKKMSKNIETIAAHAERSDPDWAEDFVRIFMKSQHCTKLDNAMIDAKAGQTLACFAHSILVKFGAWCRYMEKKLLQCLPENVYLHSRKNFNEFNAWVKRFKLNDRINCVESDYSAFDRSQDAVSLGIEVLLMQDLNLPTEVIEDYKQMKTTLGSKLGNFAIMRFTGEFSTFLFNTVSNMAFTAMMYKDVGDYPICFAGDDMCCLGDIEVNEGSVRWMNDLRLTAKVFRSRIPTFCGWCLSSAGIFKHPELLLFRMRCAVEKGKVLDCLDSYALEFSYAYMLSDDLYRFLDENCFNAHQETTMLFMRYRHKMHVTTRECLGWVNGKNGK